MGGLAVSRAFADFFYKASTLGNGRYLVSNTPFVRHLSVSNRFQFLIMASDGIWDVISNQVSCYLPLCMFGP